MIKILIICIMVTSCHQSEKMTSSESCISSLQKGAKEDWHYKPDCNCYEGTNAFYNMINSNKACIQTISKNKLIELLGPPTSTTSSSVRYRLYPCDQTKCTSYEFYFDVTEKITDFTTFHSTMTREE